MAGDCIRLTAVERVKIELGLRDGLSLTAIAAELGRPKGTTRDGFVEGMLRIPAPLRLTMTYDQGKEMARHRELAVATGIRVYFADPHSPWQRGSNENVNGLLRQYLPKGADLTKFAQAHLDGIAADLNSRPRKRHNYATPDEVRLGELRQ